MPSYETASAALAESQPDLHAQSMSTLRKLGGILVASAVECSSEATGTEETLARDDFLSAIGEHIKTDEEFGAHLDVEPSHSFDVEDGHVLAVDGTPLRSIIDKGVKASRRAALTEPRMQVEIRREEGDLQVLDVVESLSPGELVTFVSIEPKEAMALSDADREFWERKCYREGLAFIQFYYLHQDGKKLTAGSYSADHSDLQAWRRVQMCHGATIPEDVSCDDFIRYGSKQMCDSSETAQKLAADLRSEYYKMVGVPHERYSISAFLEVNSKLIASYFQQYVKPLSRAVFSADNNPEMQSLAQAILQSSKPSQLVPSVARELMRVAHRSDFSKAAGPLMDGIIRYAIVEDLRLRLKQSLQDWRASQQGQTVKTRQTIAYITPAIERQLYAHHLARNIQTGGRAGRSYAGSCNGAANIFTDTDNEDTNADGKLPQDVFGGNISSTESSKEAGPGTCEYVTDQCYCCAYDINGRQLIERRSVRVFKDARGKAHCLRVGCEAWLAQDGKHDIGNIARKARKLEVTTS